MRLPRHSLRPQAYAVARRISMTKSSPGSILYPGRDLNPHRYYYPQDFKSCVSTSFTTRAEKNKKGKKKKKAASSMRHFLMSGKRDSNSRPRPWQGRALPTELLPRGLSVVLERNDKGIMLLEISKNFFSKIFIYIAAAF